MKSPLIAAALIASLSVPTAVAGTSDTEAFSVEVEVDRSALNNTATIKEEYDRIHQQVAQRCEAEHDGFPPLKKYIAVRNCVNTTMDNTVRKINHAELTHLHAGVRLG